MRTYLHGLIGWLVYLKGTLQEKKLAALGAMLPDFILVLGFIFHFTGAWETGKTFHNLFHHSQLHTVTVLMHSFLIAVPLLLLSYIAYKKSVPFFIGMISHIVVD